MWTGETIFSEGDLNDVGAYADFIAMEYDGSREGRREHIREMLERLTVEAKMLDGENGGQA